jgi:uncharacterized protein (DUF2249 family)
MMNTTAAEIDVRAIAPHERHAQLFARFDALRPGETFVIVNDHDPVPLRMQLNERSPRQLAWKYLQSGPALWRVQIGRQLVVQAASDDSCCSGGSCGGG